jgi:3-hydroxybenzoate 6-monooxygenase
VTFHSRQQEQWGVTDGSKEEVESYFQGICPKARQLIELPKTWKRWATADREPIPNWVFGRTTILGDAAHPTTQYMAQGACMAMEDAVTLGEALRVTRQADGSADWDAALQLYQKNRIARTGRIVLSGREMGRLYHAAGVERLIRNSLWKGRSQERFYDAIEWLYGWNVNNCLQQG